MFAEPNLSLQHEFLHIFLYFPYYLIFETELEQMGAGDILVAS